MIHTGGGRPCTRKVFEISTISTRGAHIPSSDSAQWPHTKLIIGSTNVNKHLLMSLLQERSHPIPAWSLEAEAGSCGTIKLEIISLCLSPNNRIPFPTMEDHRLETLCDPL